MACHGEGILVTTKDYTVFRYNPASDEKPYYIIYEIPMRHGMTVLDGLIYIIEELDPSLSMRYNCRFKACGSCAVMINGSQRLACDTQAENYKSIRVEPLNHFKVIKDLVVDIDPFLDKMNAAMPYLVPKSDDGIPEVPPEEFDKYRSPSDCIWCGSCTSACPIAGSQPYYLGPAALNQLYRFSVDSRELDGVKDLRLVKGDSGTSGVWRCHQVFACQSVCPKKIDPGHSIVELKRMIIRARLSHD
ncbi:succinate dehydrogenase/fumarate reductase iron-sulfur subunit [Candidatus Bathyarchaeota archaeon]|nr:MAG: succinate dehydrogenase/fumarate reductase iron-sulfur subunit [Candidatus Bathyarchaeota archaeon]